MSDAVDRPAMVSDLNALKAELRTEIIENSQSLVATLRAELIESSQSLAAALRDEMKTQSEEDRRQFRMLAEDVKDSVRIVTEATAHHASALADQRNAPPHARETRLSAADAPASALEPRAVHRAGDHQMRVRSSGFR